MSIALMAYIPDYSIIRAVKNSVQGYGQFNNTKIACKMSAVFSDNLYDFFSYFLGKCFKFFMRKIFYIN